MVAREDPRACVQNGNYANIYLWAARGSVGAPTGGGFQAGAGKSISSRRIPAKKMNLEQSVSFLLVSDYSLE